jgi:hypothetical protein
VRPSSTGSNSTIEQGLITEAGFRQLLFWCFLPGRSRAVLQPPPGEHGPAARDLMALGCMAIDASFEGSPWVGLTRDMDPPTALPGAVAVACSWPVPAKGIPKVGPAYWPSWGYLTCPTRPARRRRSGQGAGPVPHSEGDRIRQRGFRVTGYRRPGQQLAADGDAGPRRCPMAPCGKKVL